MRQTISILIVIGIVLLINLLSQKYFLRFDLTEDKQYTLSDATVNILSELDQAVSVTAYFSENLPSNVAKNKQDFRDLLTEYASRSKGNLDFAFESPNESPELEQQVLQKGIQPVMINVREKDQVKQQKAYMGAVINMGEQEDVIPFIQPGAAMEYALTTGIKKLAVQDKPAIGLIQGYGCPSLQEMGQVLESLSILYSVEGVDLSAESEIPTRFQTIAMVRPTDSISISDLDKLEAFLQRGGNLICALNAVQGDFQTAQGNALANPIFDWLAQKGIQVQPEFVIDARCGTVSIQQRQGFFTMNTPVQFPYLPRIAEFGDHPATNGLEEVMFEFASPIVYSGEMNWQVLLTTSNKSGQVSTPLTFDVANKEWTSADFPESNIPVAGILDQSVDGKGKLVIFSDGDFAVSGQRGRSEDNISLFVNTIDWLSDDTGLIDLRTKGVKTRPIAELEEEERSRMKWLNFLFPLIGVIGVGVARTQWNKRKRIRRMNLNIS